MHFQVVVEASGQEAIHGCVQVVAKVSLDGGEEDGNESKDDKCCLTKIDPETGKKQDWLKTASGTAPSGLVVKI